MLAGVSVTSMVFLFWQSRRLVFVDKICIHQTDLRLKAEGLFNLAAFLKHSRSLLICWDPTYVTLGEGGAATSWSGSAGIDLRFPVGPPCSPARGVKHGHLMGITISG